MKEFSERQSSSEPGFFIYASLFDQLGTVRASSALPSIPFFSFTASMLCPRVAFCTTCLNMKFSLSRVLIFDSSSANLPSKSRLSVSSEDIYAFLRSLACWAETRFLRRRFSRLRSFSSSTCIFFAFFRPSLVFLCMANVYLLPSQQLPRSLVDPKDYQ